MQKNCYMFADYEQKKKNPNIVRRTTTTFNDPMKKIKTPSSIFTCSYSDWFVKEADAWRTDAWDVIRKTPWHQYRILTKRPERIDKSTLPADWWPDGWAKQWRHVWLGVSAEDQYFADKRMDLLRNIPTRVRWVSCEPLLAPINLNLTDFHLVVDGAETGKNARPAHINWFRSIRDQCTHAEVCYVHLQNGRALNNGMKCKCHKQPSYQPGVGCPGNVPGCRLLDGTFHQKFPT